MKIRNGFVSNSSTSSFICDICGGVEAGMDLSLSDAEMCQCKNSHCFHDVCLKNVTKNLPEEKYDFNESFCPICQLKSLTDKDAHDYIKYVLGRSDKSTLKDIKDNFRTYEEFLKFVEEKRKGVEKV